MGLPSQPLSPHHAPLQDPRLVQAQLPAERSPFWGPPVPLKDPRQPGGQPGLWVRVRGEAGPGRPRAITCAARRSPERSEAGGAGPRRSPPTWPGPPQGALPPASALPPPGPSCRATNQAVGPLPPSAQRRRLLPWGRRGPNWWPSEWGMGAAAVGAALWGFLGCLQPRHARARPRYPAVMRPVPPLF